MHVEVIRRWARSGKIPSFRTGRVWRFDLDAVEAALRSRSNA
jgi:excisionase family DNA binding protein